MAVTVTQLIVQAKEAADLTNVADYVTDAQWTSWANDAAKELHRLVTNKFKDTYFKSEDFTLTAGQSQHTLPSDFWKLKGLDIWPDTPRRKSVRPYNFGERNAYQQNTLRSLGAWCRDRHYALLGSGLLKIQAQEQAEGSYRAYYVPKPLALTTGSSTIDPELEPFSEYIWLTMAIKSLVKEESFAQAKELKDQRNLIRTDLTEALEQDEGGPSTIIDTDGGDW